MKHVHDVHIVQTQTEEALPYTNEQIRACALLLEHIMKLRENSPAFEQSNPSLDLEHFLMVAAEAAGISSEKDKDSHVWDAFQDAVKEQMEKLAEDG